MLNDLLLISGNDIPFVDAQVTIHQPTIKEIAYIGEEAFFSGCELLNFSKDILNNEDKINLEDKSNFEVFMSVMKDKNSNLKKTRVNVMEVLTLMFPEYKIMMKDNCILLTKEGEPPHIISEANFETFKQILVEMFCLRKTKGAQDYNPKGDKAREIAEKLKRGRQKAAAARGQNIEKVAIFSRYISILAVGEQKDISSLLQYTVYQLFDEFERFNLKEDFDTYVQLKMAGAKDVEEVEHWMKEIH